MIPEKGILSPIIKNGTEYNFLFAIHVGMHQWDFMERGSKLCGMQLLSKNKFGFTNINLFGDDTFYCLRPTEGTYVTYQYLGYHYIRLRLIEVNIFGKRKYDFCLEINIHGKRKYDICLEINIHDQRKYEFCLEINIHGKCKYVFVSNY